MSERRTYPEDIDEIKIEFTKSSSIDEKLQAIKVELKSTLQKLSLYLAEKVGAPGMYQKPRTMTREGEVAMQITTDLQNELNALSNRKDMDEKMVDQLVEKMTLTYSKWQFNINTIKNFNNAFQAFLVSPDDPEVLLALKKSIIEVNAWRNEDKSERKEKNTATKDEAAHNAADAEKKQWKKDVRDSKDSTAKTQVKKFEKASKIIAAFENWRNHLEDPKALSKFKSAIKSYAAGVKERGFHSFRQDFDSGGALTKIMKDGEKRFTAILEMIKEIRRQAKISDHLRHD